MTVEEVNALLKELIKHVERMNEEIAKLQGEVFDLKQRMWRHAYESDRYERSIKNLKEVVELMKGI